MSGESLALHTVTRNHNTTATTTGTTGTRNSKELLKPGRGGVQSPERAQQVLRREEDARGRD